MKLSENKQTFGFRKLTVGLASVTLATTFLAYHSSAQVKAAKATSETVSNSSENQDVARETTVTNQAVSNSIATNSNTTNANVTEKDAGADAVPNEVETSSNDKASASTTNAEIANKADLEASKEKPKDRPFVAMLAANAKKETVTRPKITPESAPEVIIPKITSDLASEESGSAANVDGKTVNPSDPRPRKQTKTGQDTINIHWIFADNSVTPSKDGLIVDPDLSGQNVRDDAKIVYQKYELTKPEENTSSSFSTDSGSLVGSFHNVGNLVTLLAYGLQAPSENTSDMVYAGSGSILIRNDLAGEGTTADPIPHIDPVSANYSFYKEGDIKGIPTPKIIRNGHTYIAGAISVAGNATDTKLGDSTLDVSLPLSSYYPGDNNYDVTIYYFRDVKDEPIDVKVKYLDSDDANRVVDEKTISGKVGDSVLVPTDIPENYEYQNKDSVPTEILLTENLRNDSTPLEIYLVHVKQDVQVTKDVSRTVVGIDPKTNEEFEITKQTAHFTGHIVKDMVTGKTTDPEWDQSHITLDKVTPTAILGYSPDTLEVASTTVNPEMESFRVTVRYTANDGIQTIVYRDQTDGDVGKQTINGKTGQTVDVAPKIPDGYIVKGEMPSTVTIKDKDTPIVVTVEHGMTHVDHDHPVDKGTPIPDTEGKLFPAGLTRDDLNKTITRTVNIIDPHTQKAATTTQKVTFTRGATVDNVTGEITYDNWSENGKHIFDKVDVPDAPGYVASGNVPSLTVTPDSQSTTVTVTYVANDDLNKAVTRTINITDPSGKKTTILQTVTFTRDSTVDKLTGKVTYGNWSENGKHTFDKVDVPYIPGYKASEEVPEVTVTPDSKSTTVDVTYAAKTYDVYVFYDYVATSYDKDSIDRSADFISDRKSFDRYANGEVGIAKPEVLRGHYGESINIPIKQVQGYYVDPYRNYSNHKFGMDAITGQELSWYDFSPTGYKDLKDPLPEDASDLDKEYSMPRFIFVDYVRDYAHSGYNNSGYNIGYVDTEGAVIGRPTALRGISGTDANFTAPTFAGYTLTNPQDVPAKFGKRSQDIFLVYKPQDVKVTYHYVDEAGKGLSPSVVEDNHFTGLINIDKNAKQIDGYRLVSTPKERVVNGLKDLDLSFVYAANDGTQTIIYRDKTDGDVGKQTIEGKTDQTVKVMPEIPEGYVAKGEIPETVTIKAKDTPIIVEVGHKENGPTNIPGVFKEYLYKIITRTVNITDPYTQKVTTTKQKVTFKCVVTVDRGTSEATYGNWSADGKNTFDQVNVPTVPGYTANGAVPSVAVTPDTQSSVIDIKYIANDSSQTISYRDPKDGEVGTQVISGKTDETVKVTPQIPKGWTVVGDLPAEVTIKPKDDPIVVTVEHKVITIDHNNPVDEGQPIPGEGGQKYPTGLSKDDLNKTIVREIEIDFPSSKKSITDQSVTFTRDANLDLVTGEVKYKPWSEDGKRTFAKVEAPKIKGYVATNEAPSIVVTPESPAYTKVQIGYKAVKDSQGITETTDETVNVPKPDVSEEWHITDQVPEETAIQPEDKTATVTISHNVVRVTRNKTVKFDDGKPDESHSKFPSGLAYGKLNRTIMQVNRPTAVTASSVMDVAQASHTPQTQNQATQLPQTGAKDGFAIVALGLVLISLSAASLATKKRD